MKGVHTMTNKVIIYQDGYDLYLTEEALNEQNYERIVGKRDSLSDAIDEAKRLTEEDTAEYVWIDRALLTEGIDLRQYGVFAVIDGDAIELDIAALVK